MKRILVLVMVAMLLTCGAYAEDIDFSSMSYEELVAMKEQINLAIWNSEDWQEVEVPQGVYVIGEDIPAGKWTIKAAEGLTATVYWGDTLDEAGVKLTYDGELYVFEGIYSTSYKYYENGDTSEVTWELKDGQYFIVDDGIALFTPYAGKPDLGFKK